MEENLRLVNALEALGCYSCAITSGVITADYLDREKYRFVGRITNVDRRPLTFVLHDGNGGGIHEQAFGCVNNNWDACWMADGQSTMGTMMVVGS